MTSVTLSSDAFCDHKFHNLVLRALFPHFFGGAAGTRPTSKAREKRLGDEVANFINFFPGITRFLLTIITILNLIFFFSVGALLGIISGGVVLLVVILLVCCFWSKCPLAKCRARRGNGRMAVVHYPRTGIVQTTLPPYPGAGMQTTTHPYPAGAGIQTASQPYPAGAGIQATIQPYPAAGPQAISPPYPVTGQTQNAGPPYPGTGVQVQDGNQVYGKN